MGDINIVALVVAVVGAGGIGVAIREIVGVVTLARNGMSGKEDKRRNDIVAQRDLAIQQAKEAKKEADAADARADREADSRRRYQEAHARLRRRLIEQGIEPGEWPEIDETTGPPGKQ